jgi:maleate cis-trans isomerase
MTRDQPPRVGLLYPTRGAGEDDFALLAARLHPPVVLETVYLPWPAGVEDLAAMDLPEVTRALTRLGSFEHLQAVLPSLLGARRFDVLAFAVTSASFLVGRRGVERQRAWISSTSGIPAVSTTSAFQAAVRHLGLSRVALASVYHPEISGHFVDRIRETGARVVSRVDDDAGSDRQLAAWGPERIIDLVGRAARPDAEAVLLPETALHTADLTDRLENAAGGVPVLTATQVTLWEALHRIGFRAQTDAAGPLFASSAD